MTRSLNVLVTAGNTATPIDQVRVISNIFRGRTGRAIAEHFAARNCHVTLMTSEQMEPFRRPFSVIRYRSFDDLAELLAGHARSRFYDVIIHSAAVSDYRPVAIHGWQEGVGLVPIADPRNATKISSAHERMFIELAPTPKLIDSIREPWGFEGKLVKFKLQVGISDDELLAIARRSVAHSKADYIVANCLEWSRERAYIVAADGSVENIRRDLLGAALFERLSS